MNDMRKTGIFVGVAALLVVIALVTAPKRVTPEAFFDEGEMFFPDFENPNDARTLEVIQFDGEQGAAVPFKVTFEGGRWTIPSHHGYPADGADRLAQTAAGLIGITRDDFRTDNPADYAACGVIDPLDDANPSMAGRGVRVTIKGENELVLADIIIGKGFDDREGFHLVRLPNQKRVYGTRLDLELSTQFKDWIEPDLMFIEKEEVTNVVLKDYSVEETTGSLDERDEVMLARIGENWAMASMPEDRELDTYKLNGLVQAVDELAIEGVRPKPEGLSAMLSATEGQMQITQADMLSLQSKGFYFTRDGQLVSNEGEVQVHTSDGVVYTLRFRRGRGGLGHGRFGRDRAARRFHGSGGGEPLRDDHHVVRPHPVRGAAASAQHRLPDETGQRLDRGGLHQQGDCRQSGTGGSRKWSPAGDVRRSSTSASPAGTT